jgi:hypothetical protein
VGGAMDSHGHPISQLQYSTYLPSIDQSLDAITTSFYTIYALAKESCAADRHVMQSAERCAERQLGERRLIRQEALESPPTRLRNDNNFVSLGLVSND